MRRTAPKLICAQAYALIPSWLHGFLLNPETFCPNGPSALIVDRENQPSTRQHRFG
jgi:hypothetical protein